MSNMTETKSALAKYLDGFKIRSDHAPYKPDPALPLWQVAWEDERIDLPGVGSVSYGHNTVEVRCYCGQRFSAESDHRIAREDAVLADLISHAQRNPIPNDISELFPVHKRAQRNPEHGECCVVLPTEYDGATDEWGSVTCVACLSWKDPL